MCELTKWRRSRRQAGPQYVCTNFSTFVCTPCSGIHREFTHRVISVSMAKFTSQEVSALQGGGSASAREIYLKEWDSQRNSLPDGSNVQRLRDFVKHVYVERRFTAERKSEKTFRSTMGECDEFQGSKNTYSYRGDSRSPPYEGHGDGPVGRSLGYNQEMQRNSDKRSPTRSDVVNEKLIAGEVIREVNKKYQTLEIDLESLYKRRL